MAEQGDLYFDPDAPDADVDDYGALLTTHLTTRRCNNASRSPTPERKISRREQAARVFVSEREARGLADDAPANPQAPWIRPPEPHKSSPSGRRKRKFSSTPAEDAAAATSSKIVEDGDGSSNNGNGNGNDGDNGGGGTSDQNFASLADLASAGKAVPGSKQELVLLAASVSAAAAELRTQCAASGMVYSQPTPLDDAAKAKQPVGFKLNKATKLRPDKVFDGTEDEPAAATAPTASSNIPLGDAAMEGRAAIDRINGRQRKSRWTKKEPPPPPAAPPPPPAAPPPPPAAVPPPPPPPPAAPPPPPPPPAGYAPILRPDERREAELRSLALQRLQKRQQQARQSDAW